MFLIVGESMQNRDNSHTSHVPAAMESLEQRRLLSGSAPLLDPIDPPAGLLLPAVQKVREAAIQVGEIAELHSIPTAAPLGLLLPAVQKVTDPNK